MSDGRQVSIKQITWRHLRWMALWALLACGVVLLLGQYVLHKDHESFERQRWSLLMEDVAGLVDFYQQVVDKIARDPVVHDLIQFREVERAVAWAKETKRFLPSAIGLALATETGEVLGEPLLLRLGPQCMIDLRKMLKNEPVGLPPIHDDVKSLSHFDITSPVLSNGTAVGVVIASFSLDLIDKRLQRLGAEGQGILLSDSKGHAIAATEGYDFTHMAERHTFSGMVAGTDWQLTYIPERHDYSAFLVSLFVIGGLLLAIFSMLVMSLALRLGGIFNQDMRLVRDQFRALERGEDVGQRCIPVLKETSQLANEIFEIAGQIEETRQELIIQSQIDELTGLFNRRVMYERFGYFLEMSERSVQSYLLLMDIDGLKQINDRHGQCVGDDVLQLLAVTLAERAGATDVVGRIGDDEFAVILVQTDREGVLDWYRDTIKEFSRLQPLLWKGTERICSVSCGAIPVDNERYPNVSRLLDAADKRLYHAKKKEGDHLSVEQVSDRWSIQQKLTEN